jgi:hypothetical protein
VAPGYPLPGYAPTPPAAAYPLYAAPPVVAADPGWAHGAATFGFVSAAVVMALTVAVMANNDPESAETARGLGALAIIYLGVAAPVTAAGGSSARMHPAVIGTPGLRVVSWVGYALALLDALALLGLSFDNEINSGHILSVGILGSLSTLGFAIDARASAAQAEALRASPRHAWLDGGGLRLAPALSVTRSPEGGAIPMLGWRASF